jgi:hypothetical protein
MPELSSFYPGGAESVENGVGAKDYQYFTSVDGASFQLSEAGATPLSLVNGWTNGPDNTSNAAARIVGGVVYLQGAVSDGTANLITTLPPAMRPTTNVYVRIVNLCGTFDSGGLLIGTDGTVTIHDFVSGHPECLVSLDGVTFVQSAAVPLTLENGWTNSPFGTTSASFRNIGGIVRLKGAISTTSSNPNKVPFTLPVGSRPAVAAFIPVDMCNATPGDLLIGTDGTVTVQAQGGTASNAQCLTSLDGAWFANAN